VAFRGGPPASRSRLGTVERSLRLALHALGGDHARPRSGPAPRSATFSYLRARWNGGKDRRLNEAAFRDNVLKPLYGLVGRRLNLERVELSPLLTDDDHFFFTVIEGRRTRAGLPADPAPPFRLYRANVNQARSGSNPLVGFHHRWYR